MLLGEPGWETLLERMETAHRPLVPAVGALESGMVMLSRKGPAGAAELDQLLACMGAVVAPFDAEQAAIARDAFARYGKGRHPAALNLGDCAAYALAVSRAVPLLFKGTDFALTDVQVA